MATAGSSSNGGSAVSPVTDSSISVDAVEELRRRLLHSTPPLSSASLSYCTETTLRRYLMKYSSEVNGKVQRPVDEAEVMLRNTLSWRSEHIDGRDLTISPPMVADPCACSFLTVGKDKEGRPIIYGCPARANVATPVDDIMLHISMGLERALNSTSQLHSSAEWIWIVDCHGFGTKHVNIPLAMKMANIFKSHFREQVHACYLVDPPKALDVLLKAVSTVATHQTLSKISSVHGFEEYTLLLYKLLLKADTVGRNWMLVVYSMDAAPGNIPPLPKGWNPHFGRNIHEITPENDTTQTSSSLVPSSTSEKF